MSNQLVFVNALSTLAIIHLTQGMEDGCKKLGLSLENAQTILNLPFDNRYSIMLSRDLDKAMQPFIHDNLDFFRRVCYPRIEQYEEGLISSFELINAAIYEIAESTKENVDMIMKQ